MLSSSMSFKSKLLTSIVAFAVLPIVVIIFVLHYNYAKEDDEKIKFILNSNNIRLSEIIDGYYYRNLSSVVSSLDGVRQKLYIAGYTMVEAINLAKEKSKSEGVNSIIKDTIFDTVSDSGMASFVFNQKNPEASYYLKQKYRALLKYNVLTEESFYYHLTTKEFLKTGTYHVLRDIKKQSVYLAFVIAVDDSNVVVVADDLTELSRYHNIVDEKLISALSIVITSEGVEVTPDRVLKSFIADKQGVQIVPKSKDAKSVFRLDREIVENTKTIFAKQRHYMHKGYVQGEECSMFTTYYAPLNLYIVSAIKTSDILKNRNEINRNFFVIGLVVCSMALIITIYLVSNFLVPLGKVTRNAKALVQLDLNNKEQVDTTVKKFTIEGDDEVSDISKALGDMIRNLSNNTRELLLTQDRQRKIEGELNTAKDIQLGILPDHLDSKEFNPLKLNGTMIPAKEVGGDLYDVFCIDEDNVAIIIGDVSDKGVPAALFMAMTVTVIRECFLLKMSPCAVMNEVNKILCQHNPNMMFVTLFLSVLNKRTGKFEYANGGHCQPVICHNGEISLIDKISGPAPGVAEGFEYTGFETCIEDKSKLFLYTDGVSEAQNFRQELFGEERIYQNVKKFSTRDVKLFSFSMLGEVYRFRGTAPQSDDITMLVVDVNLKGDDH